MQGSIFGSRRQLQLSVVNDVNQPKSIPDLANYSRSELSDFLFSEAWRIMSSSDSLVPEPSKA
jgi:hypothetical protein